MRGMVEVTLVRGSEEMLENPASNVVACRSVDFTTTEFPIRRNARGYSLPSQWTYMPLLSTYSSTSESDEGEWWDDDDDDAAEGGASGGNAGGVGGDGGGLSLIHI